MPPQDIKTLGELAPSISRIYEQTDKIEEALPSRTNSDPGGLKHKPLIEDFVFFAAAQRAADREEDGVM
jgi:hypothetical protein